MSAVKLDFKNDDVAQDLIIVLSKELNLSIKDTIIHSVNKDCYDRIVEVGWARYAYPAWGHGDSYKKYQILSEPSITVHFSDIQMQLIDYIMAKEKTDFETCVGYFLLFEAEKLQHHL